jgi:hypothetical protein
VAEKRALGEADPFSYLRDRRLLKPTFSVQVQRGLLKSVPGIGFPSAHIFNSPSMTVLDIISNSP